MGGSKGGKVERTREKVSGVVWWEHGGEGTGLEKGVRSTHELSPSPR